ncbi:MAG TPA: RagB/SusD family nutrient uptake outer membrane protein [Phnomibacter sp.]|nr:RagB/SusD family nutrient uptake outer membrane protein [Phnomibacter sp.]
MKISLVALAVASLWSCKKEFTERAALDATTIDNYYNTAEEVRGLTSTLYGIPWAGYENRAQDAVGDVMSGNAYTSGSDDAPFVNFSLSSASVRIADGWKVFYKIGGWASEYINGLELKKANGGKAEFLDPAIAECHFMKGTVYFYIARLWGDAPIVNQPGGVIKSGDFEIPRYYKADVLRFALEELKKAEAGLPESDVPGRVTKYSAKGMMAKLYLYRGNYDSAKMKAQEVIASKKFELEDDYAAMFNTSAKNFNKESLFSIQHQLTGNPWGSGNQKQCDRGPGNLQTSESNMWELYIPSMDIRSAYESGDTRRKGSMMEHGWEMLNWKPKGSNPAYNAFMAGGYKYDTMAVVGDGGQKNPTRSNIAKYVVGPGSGFGGEGVLGMNTGLNTPMLRYADILLIYAEAVLGASASTSDASALNAYNEVRKRAKLLPKTTSITKDDILKERRVEFAFEGDYWFDIQRQGFAKAKAIIEAQNRGTAEFPSYVKFTEQYMHLPIPAAEILQDPALGKPAVPYY